MQLAASAAVGEQEAYAWTRVQLGLLELGRATHAPRWRRCARRCARSRATRSRSTALAQAQAALGRLAAAIRYERAAVDRVPLPQYVSFLGDLYGAAGPAAAAQRAVRADRRDREAARRERRPQRPRHRALRRRPRPAPSCTRSRSPARATPAGRASSATTCSAWALARNGRMPRRRSRYSQRSLRLGTKDALKLFHRGWIAACLGRDRGGAPLLPARARAQPALLDPVGARRPEGSCVVKKLVVLASPSSAADAWSCRSRRRRTRSATSRSTASRASRSPVTACTCATCSTWPRSRPIRRASRVSTRRRTRRRIARGPARHARRPRRRAAPRRARARVPARRRRPAHDAPRADPARPARSTGNERLVVHDTNYADRIGWKEIVVGAGTPSALGRAARLPEEPPAEPSRHDLRIGGGRRRPPTPCRSCRAARRSRRPTASPTPASRA